MSAKFQQGDRVLCYEPTERGLENPSPAIVLEVYERGGRVAGGWTEYLVKGTEDAHPWQNRWAEEYLDGPERRQVRLV